MLSLPCPHCSSLLQFPPETAGQRVKCPRCSGVVQVPVPLAVTVSAGPAAVPPQRDPAPPPAVAAANDDIVTVPPAQGTPEPGEYTRNLASALADRPDTTEQALRALLTPPQAPGELGRLGSYRVLRVLGAGGMGAVFEGEDPVLRRTIALKVMLSSQTGTAQGRQRFLEEARAAAALQHDHIVPIYQVGEDRGVPFFAMPLLRGESLEARLRREGRLPVRDVLRIGCEIAEGLAAAHEAGLVHRDIKPANVWLEAPSGRVKILDFGLARPASRSQELTQPGAFVGTPAYMSPEQGQGQPVDPRTDLFSLGCVLYRMSTGAMPFKGTDPLAILVAVVTEQPRPPSALVSDLPPGLSDFILRLLAKDRGQRPPSARAVVKALQAIGEGAANVWATLQGSETLVSPELVPRPEPTIDARWLRLAIALVGVLILGSLVAALLFYRSVTNQGELVLALRGENVDAEIDVRRQGKQVALFDTRRQKTISLPPGEYEIALANKEDDLKLSTERVTIQRGKTVSVTLEPIIWSIADGLVVCRRGRGQCKTLGEAVARASEGMRIVVRKGEYYESVTVSKRLRIEGETREETLIEGPRGACLTLDADGIEVRNLILRCRASSERSRPGVTVRRGEKIVLENCYITTYSTGTGDIALLTGRGGAALDVRGPTTEVVVRRCHLHESRTHGMSVTAGARGLLEDCQVNENLGCGLVCENGILVVRKCKVHENMHTGLVLFGGADVTVERSRFFGNRGTAIQVTQSGTRARIKEGCSISSNQGYGIYIVAADAAIQDCEIIDNRYGVYASAKATVNVQNSRIKRNREWGIAAAIGGRVHVEKCDLTENTLGPRHELKDGKIEGTDNKE